jgi:hypothetical protein
MTGRRIRATISLEVGKICDACTAGTPFRIPDGIGMIEFHQGLRISYRLLHRHRDSTINNVLVLAVSGEGGTRASSPISRESRRCVSDRPLTLRLQINHYSHGADVLEHTGESTR